MQRGNISGGMRPEALLSTLIRLQARCSPCAIESTPHDVKTLGNLTNRQNISLRLAGLSLEDARRWGTMSVHQMVCHLDDAYKLALGEKNASMATGLLQR